MKNIHVLLTDKPSTLWVNNLRRRIELDKDVLIGSNTAQHIYITSDDKITSSQDWFIDIKDNRNHLHQVGYDLESVEWNDQYNPLYFKKIILTTDQGLIKYGVQVIDDEFLEWFVKNPSCEEVEVYREGYKKNGMIDEATSYQYKIIIPKEEPKDINAHTGFDEEGHSLNYQGNILPLNNIDPVRFERQQKSFNLWRSNKARGGIEAVTGFGKTFIAIKESKQETTIPKEEPKKEYIKCGDCNKYYLCTTCGAQCGSEGHFIEITKQESLEEAAKRIISDMGWVWGNIESAARRVAEYCAKWQQEHYGLMEIELRHTKTLLASCEKALEERDKQQERMYSEKEVLNLLYERESELNTHNSIFNYQDAKEWFEQFKKK
ncbi:MAG: hypothetical protein ACK5SE_14870 [Pseudanabaena sp.]